MTVFTGKRLLKDKLLKSLNDNKLSNEEPAISLERLIEDGRDSEEGRKLISILLC